MVTYNTIIRDFKKFLTAHDFINNFISGVKVNVDENEQLYPLALVSVQPSTIVSNQYQATKKEINFLVFFIDRLSEGSENGDEIYSDMLQVAGDFIAHFQDNDDVYGFAVDSDVPLIPVYEEMDDIVCGWIANIKVTYRFNSQDCFLPISEE